MSRKILLIILLTRIGAILISIGLLFLFTRSMLINYETHEKIMKFCTLVSCTLLCETKGSDESIGAYIVRYYTIDLEDNKITDLQTRKVFKMTDCTPLEILYDIQVPRGGSNEV